MGPVLVALLVGSAAAGEFSVVQRLSQAALIPPAALMPLLGAYVARRRGESNPITGANLLRSVYAYGILGLIGGVGLVGLGGPIGNALLSSPGAVDRWLLVLFAILGVLWCAELALGSHLSGAQAVQPVLRLTVATSLTNIGISVVLTIRYGSGGPVVASIAATVLSLVLMMKIVRGSSGIFTGMNPAHIERTSGDTFGRDGSGRDS